MNTTLCEGEMDTCGRAVIIAHNQHDESARVQMKFKTCASISDENKQLFEVYRTAVPQRN
jgi:hypothetical protein